MFRARFVFDRIPEGNYDVHVTSDLWGHAVAQDVAVARAAPRVPVVIEATARGRIDFRLTDTSGAPVPFADVFVFDADSVDVMPDRRFVTSEAGRILIRGLAPGRYACIARTARRPAVVVGETEVFAGGISLVEGAMEEGGTLRVRCRDDDGRPLAGIVVEIESTSSFWPSRPVGSPPRHEMVHATDVRGEIVFDSVPAGDFSVWVERAGERHGEKTGVMTAAGEVDLNLVVEKKSVE